MATDLERLVVSLSADIKKYENAMNRAMGVTNQRAKAIESRFAKMNGNVNASFQNALRGATALAGTALGVSEIQQYADAWTEAGNKIASASSIAGVQARSLEDLRKGADGARSSFETYVDLYAKLIRSASGVAQSEQEIATATDVVTKAFKAGGAATQEQIAGILQLSQALGSGVLQGDELRSLRENAPLVAKAIADEFGTTIAGLKKLGEDGKLTSDRVFKAILAAQKPIEAAFASTNATIADGFTKLKNSVTEYVGQQAKALGVTAAVNGILDALAGKIGSVANAAAAAAITLGAMFAGPALVAGAAALLNPFVLLAAAVGGAAYAFTEFYDTIIPLQGSFATLGDYATALWQILGDGADQTRATIVAAFDTILSTINSALSGVGLSMDDVWGALRESINAIINSFVKMKDVVVATFDTVPAAVGDAVLSAMNSMIAGVETGINKVISAVNSAVSAINSLGSYAGVAALPTIDSVSLSRIENTYAGAGERASKAFQDAINRKPTDYIGAAGNAVASSVDNAVNRITARANEIAAARQELDRETNRAANFGGVKTPTNNTKGFGGGVKTDPSGGGKGKGDAFKTEVRQIQDRTAALLAETEAQSKLNPLLNDFGYAVEFAASKQDLLNAAKQAGKKITPELTAEIEKLAAGYANASAASEKLQATQDKVREQAEFFGNAALDAFDELIPKIETGNKALDGFLNTLIQAVAQAALLGKGPFGGASGGGVGGIIGAIFGSIFHKGGVAGGPAPSRAVSPSVFAGAPRYHTGGVAGLKPGEIPAILQKGEVVLPRGTKMSGGGGSTTYSPVYQIDARGADQGAVARLERGLAERDRTESKRVAGYGQKRDVRKTRP